VSAQLPQLVSDPTSLHFTPMIRFAKAGMNVNRAPEDSNRGYSDSVYRNVVMLSLVMWRALPFTKSILDQSRRFRSLPGNVVRVSLQPSMDDRRLLLGMVSNYVLRPFGHPQAEKSEEESLAKKR
jgi:hypothetical protein